MSQVAFFNDDGEPMICPECGRPFDAAWKMKIHYSRSHSERMTGSFFPWEELDRVDCPACGQVCHTEAGMRRHHYRKHGESLARVERTCRVCGETEEMYESELDQLEHDDLCVGCARRRETNHTEEAKRKMSEAQMGRKPEPHVIEAAQEGWWEWYENGGAEEISEWMTGVSHSPSEETRKKISETLMGHEVSEETRQKIRENGRPGYVKQIDVEETGHTVRSTWEEAIDRLLYYSQYDFEFEPERFDIGGQYYLPDFIVGDDVIEVKGWVTDYSIDRAERFMDQYPEYRYICVGSEGLPCDVHIEYEQRHELLDVL